MLLSNAMENPGGPQRHAHHFLFGHDQLPRFDHRVGTQGWPLAWDTLGLSRTSACLPPQDMRPHLFIMVSFGKGARTYRDANMTPSCQLVFKTVAETLAAWGEHTENDDACDSRQMSSRGALPTIRDSLATPWWFLVSFLPMSRLYQCVCQSASLAIGTCVIFVPA